MNGGLLRSEDSRAGRVLVIAAAHSEPTERIASTTHVIEVAVNMDDDEWHAEFPVTIGRIYALTRAIGPKAVTIVTDGFRESQLRDVIDALMLVASDVNLYPENT